MSRILLMAVIGLSILTLQATGGLTWFENRLVEMRMTIAPRAPTGDVVVVDIDERSLAAIGHWPWSRSTDTAILRRLTGLGAAQIAFDVDFSAAADDTGDAQFAAALADAGGAVILPSFRQNAAAAGAATLFTQPLPGFAANAWPAIVNVSPDGDGRVRSLTYGESIDGSLVPSMAALLAGGEGRLGRGFNIDFSIDAGKLRHVSALDLLNGAVPPSEVMGKTVIVGASAVELRDFFYVPVYGLVSGAVLQALGADTLIQGRALAETGPAIALALVALLLLVAAFLRLRWTVAVAAIAVLATIAEVAAAVIQARAGLILNTAPFDAALAFLVAASVLEEIDARASRIAYLARFDTLTGFANRNQFVERLAAASSSSDHAVVTVRLDRLSLVTETFGHVVADRLVCAVAERIAPMLLPTDCLARLHGDAFAVLLAGAGATARAKALARDLVARVGEPYALGEHRLIAGLSFGVAALSRGRDADGLLRRAETALHRAEASGGNAIAIFDEAMLAGQSERQALEVELWEAFEKGQFEVHYQPQVDLRDHRVVGAEALLRWRHPDRGLLSPDVFVPLAEAVGLIKPIGEWVLNRACRDAAGWPRGMRVAVNVSPVQLARGGLLAAVKDALSASGLSPERLEIEITEAVFIADRGTVSALIADLRGMGTRVALDDFGSGYSSLAYLKRFTVDKVKLDRSFVIGIPQDQQAAAIVQAVGLLAENFGLSLTAEGIEREEQIAPLRLLGCGEGQGFFFGRPMREAELLGWLRARREPPQLRLAAANG